MEIITHTPKDFFKKRDEIEEDATIRSENGCFICEFKSGIKIILRYEHG